MRNDKEKLEKIFECLDRIAKYTDGGKNHFFRNYLIQDGVVRNLQIIGEVIKDLSDKLKKNNPHVEWRKAARMRDKVTHDYFDVNYEIIWDTVENSLPLFRSSVEKIYQQLEIQTDPLPDQERPTLEEKLRESGQ